MTFGFNYKDQGRRVRLIYADDPFTDLEPGATGTADHCDSTGTLFVNWDDGSTLGLVPGADHWEFVQEKEVINEKPLQ